MTATKKISLNFGRIDKAQVGAVAAGTLGHAVVAAPDTLPPAPDAPAAEPRGPVALIKMDDQTLEVKEKGLSVLFNFEMRKVTYVSFKTVSAQHFAAVIEEELPFDQVKSPTAISDAYANLKMLGGNPRPYTP